LYRNVCTELAVYAVQCLRRAQITNSNCFSV